MKIAGKRVVALLLLWLAVGLMADAATLPLQDEAFSQAGVEGSASGTERAQLVVGGLGAAVLVAGLTLLYQDPGAGRMPGTPLGRADEDDSGPRVCWRCRARWPAGAERCPECGVERLR